MNIEEIKQAAKLLNNQPAPMENRYLMVPVDYEEERTSACEEIRQSSDLSPAAKEFLLHELVAPPLVRQETTALAHIIALAEKEVQRLEVEAARYKKMKLGTLAEKAEANWHKSLAELAIARKLLAKRNLE